jgi:Tfp pilus assembly protein PilZ
MALGAEKRRHPRIPVDWPGIILNPGSLMSVLINNISIGGAFVHCFKEPGHDEPLRMVIKAPPREELLLVTAEMVWSNLDTTNVAASGIGVRFTKVFGDNHEFLSDTVSEHLNMVFRKEPSKN